MVDYRSMRQDDNNNDASRNEREEYQEDKNEDMEDWRNEHGNPSNTFLQKLAEEGNMEKLRAIATDLDAEFGPNDSAEDLIGSIRAATEAGTNETS